MLVNTVGGDMKGAIHRGNGRNGFDGGVAKERTKEAMGMKVRWP